MRSRVMSEGRVIPLAPFSNSGLNKAYLRPGVVIQSRCENSVLEPSEWIPVGATRIGIAAYNFEIDPNRVLYSTHKQD
jgi:hypothetical protein